MSAGAVPRLAQRLLEAVLRDPDWRESVLGDLDEEFQVVSRRGGAGRARVWYWRQALGIAARLSAARLWPGGAARRRSVLPPVEEETSRWTWLRDLRHARRALASRPALATVVVATLALALAANATIFTLADALYLRPFRFPGVDRLVVVSSVAETDPFADRSSVAPADFLEWAAQSTTLERFAAADFWDPNLSGVQEPEQLAGFRVSPAFFDVIGAQPLLGRTFRADEATPGRDRRTVLSHGLWTRRFGGDPSIVGRSIRLDGEPHEVIGVLAPGPSIPYGAELWAPLAFTPAEREARERGYLLVVARLAADRTLAQARAEMEALVGRQRQTYPETHANRAVSVSTFTRALSDEGAGPFLAIWQAAAVLLLLIACANIANLLMARGAERQQEFAVRLALGAGRGRLFRQVVFEGMWLAALAAVAALPLAAAAVDGMRRALPPSVLRWVAGLEFMQLDVRALAVTAGLGAVATMFFSLVPAMHASRAAVADALRQGGRTLTTGRQRRWLGTGLAAAQVAFTLALVVGSAMILGALDSAVNGVLGFDKASVLTAELRLPDGPYESADARRQFTERVLERMRGVPAVRAAGVASFLPYSGASSNRPVFPEGAGITPADARTANYQRVSPGYFDVLRIPILEGRGLSEADRHDTRPVALVSRSFAERYWPGQSAVGRRFRSSAEGPWFEVVGVTGDIAQDWFLQQRTPTFYRPASQEPTYGLSFVIRSAVDPRELAGELRRAVAAVDADIPLLQLRTMEQVVEDKVAGVDYLARALVAMGGLALVLALMGIYSLIAYLASRRTQEFGVRLALGATRWELIRLNLRQALAITALGLTVGAALSVVLAQVMATALFGLVSIEPWLIAGVTAAIGAVSLGAGFLPARRAAALDPIEALRVP